MIDEDFGWLKIGNVPECLVNHVRKIEVNGLTGDEDDLPLLEYLFDHG